MEIISIRFVALTILAVFIYYLLKHKYRTGYLAILSCAFIASFNYLLLPYILIYSLFNYYIGLKLPGSNRKLLLYRVAIVINILQLVVLNYASFAIDPVFQLLSLDVHVSKLAEILVPIGISYFTLQGIGYLINIKMGWEKPDKDFLGFIVYITFFPKFLSGPIERSNHFLPQLREEQAFDQKQVSDGLRIALFGFLKKVAIANQMAPFITSVFTDMNSVGGSSLWVLLFLLPLYLYFDFSGYTDIAIGFAKMFGINLLPNFDRPFFAQNVTTFWKKFHISLASWYGDYIFRQTVFKRRKWGIYASMYAVFITWTLFGIWHGAGWNFMFLGLLQALAVNYEFFTRKWRYRFFGKWPVFLKVWFGRIVTYLFYGVSLIFFFSPDLASAFQFFSGLSGLNLSIINVIYYEIPLSAIVLSIIYFFYELLQEDYSGVFDKLNTIWSGESRWNRAMRWTLYAGILSMLFVLSNQVQQFIYAQF